MCGSSLTAVYDLSGAAPLPSTIHASRLTPPPPHPKYGQLHCYYYFSTWLLSAVWWGFCPPCKCASDIRCRPTVFDWPTPPSMERRDRQQDKKSWGTKMCDKKYKEKMHATTPPPPKRTGKFKACIMYYTTSKRILYAVQC